MTSLQMTRVDLQRTINARAHRTTYYKTKHSNDVVARRGQDIKMTFMFNRPVQSGDHLTITVQTGHRPSESNTSEAVMVVSDSGSKTSWSAVRGSSSDNSLPVTMNIPVTAIVGVYKMKLQIGSASSYDLGRLFVLFNAWAPDDQVYMPNEAERQEYVLNDGASYWYGSSDNREARFWAVGQFDKDILDICHTLLERSSVHASNVSKDISHRRDAIHVGRVLSAMVNSNDGDKGVIVGNWDGDYSGGVTPTRWNGSAEILHKWIKSGPVKFGQCWVYGGVLCTVLRCLGIPARIITNFESAHDTDGNLVIDTYYKADGSKDKRRTNDSIWNFHVWNEMWSTRPDIGSLYDGWQIVDATPQEQSRGIFCLGPCSQKAVKEGEIKLHYDTKFVFSEINADSKNWMVTHKGRRLLKTRTAAVGWNTSTKAVGSLKRVDVTNDYKYPEGSAKEREIYRKALDKLGSAPAGPPAPPAPAGPPAPPAPAGPPAPPAPAGPPAPPAPAGPPAPPAPAGPPAAPAPAGPPADFSMADCEMEPQFSGAFKNAKTRVGEDLNMELALKSTADQDISVTVKVIVTSVIYNNAPFKELLTDTESVTLGVNEEKSIPIKIPYNLYKDQISPDNMIEFEAVCEDDLNGNLLVKKVVTLENLSLIIKNTEQAKVHEVTSVDVIFTNSLNEDVTDCVLKVDGSGLLEESVTLKEPTIKQGQSHTFIVKINPTRDGSRCFIADLSTNEIPSVKAFLSISVDAE